MRIMLLMALAAMACSKKAPPTCDEMTEQVRRLYDARDPKLVAPENLIDSLRLPFGCQKLDDRKRSCIMRAKTFVDLYGCDARQAVYVEPKDFVDVATQQSSPAALGPFASVTFDEKQTIRDIDPRLSAESAIVHAWCEYNLFDFERGKSLLGASARTVVKRFGFRAGSGRIKLYPTEVGDAVTAIILGSEVDAEMPEKVEGYQIEFRRTETPEVRRLLEAKFGAPHDGEDDADVYRDSPHIELYRNTLVVGVIDGP